MALRLIDDDGVEALTMRRLAAALNANPMSLYHHLPNKDAVLRGVAERVGSRFRTPERADAPWQDRLRQLALDFRALAHSHPRLMSYSFAHADFIQPDDPFWRGLTGTLAAARLPGERIPRVAATLCAVFTGFLANELNGALGRWSTLPPHSTDALPPSALAAMFACVLDAAVESVAGHAPPA
ncbi:TetR family transcriptional regulator [Streptomyces sp. NPDC048664]|uniref:TetR/AcrR family transcriptional regulator n=1 Tax=Streptomyces sp. NPDC048664 TaxID=3154505 RepID=UPI00343E8105